MSRTIDLIRASKLPSNMMQFAAKGALSVPPDENIEILVYLAKHNKIFGDVARMTLAGWDENASLAAASDPKTSREVLAYLVAPDNMRPKLLPALLENPSVSDGELIKFALSASPEAIAAMLKSPRVRTSAGILDCLRSNPYLKGAEAVTVAELLRGGKSETPAAPVASSESKVEVAIAAGAAEPAPVAAANEAVASDEAGEVPDEVISAYLAEHATEVASEQDKPFQPVGGIVDLLGTDYFPVSENKDMAPVAAVPPVSAVPAGASAAAASSPAVAQPNKNLPAKRDNAVQKINRLD